jgi:hypothetical protein
MLSLGQAKQILNDPNITVEKILEIRDNFRSLAEVIFEQWEKEKLNINNQKKICWRQKTAP